MQWVIFLKKAFIVSGVFISSIIGAGFASGNEILFYFSKFGKFGLFGILLTVMLFCVLQYLILSQSNAMGTTNFDEYLNNIMGKYPAVFISVCAYTFMIFIFSAMLSGFGEMIAMLYGIDKLWPVLFMLACCYFILIKGYNFFVKSESLLSVLIVASIIFAGFYILLFRESSVAAVKLPQSWFTSSVSYVSYNILTLSSVLCLMGKETNKKSALFSSAITFSVLFILMIIFWYILCIYSGMISLGAIPMLTICYRQSNWLGIIYSCAIFLAMLTTAITNCYVLSQKLNIYIKKPLCDLLIIVSAFFLSALDFTFIVDKLYRFVGVISVFLIFAVIRKGFFIYFKNFKKNIEKLRKQEKNKDI